MATVHLGRLEGSAGFARTVAIKRLHPHLAEDPNFSAAFADEARLAARIRHPNVVPTLDVVSTDGELLIVMEYVDGDSLSSLVRSAPGRVPLPIVVAIVSEMLHGLHSAHEARSATGKPLGIVHRDVSPQNVLVGADGVVRLVDFGIARATSKNRQATTGENDLKGKLAYMAPEQIRREDVSRRTDVFAAGIVLWELLTGQRLFASGNEAATMEKILVGWVQPPRNVVPDLPIALNDIAVRALDPDPESRFETAREMAVALEDASPRALGREVGAWVENTAAELLQQRRALVARSEKQGVPASSVSDAVSIAGEVLSATSVDPPTTPRRDAFSPPASARMITGPLPRVGPPPTPELGFEYERTVTSFGETTLPPAPRPQRSRTDRIAYGVFGAVVMVALVFALSWSRIGAAPAHAATFDFPPPPEPAAAPTPTTTAVIPGEPTAIATTAPTPPPVVAPIVRSRPVKPRPVVSSPPKQPCVSKLDPATGKKIYQGDCD